ncbi:MAG: DUF2207 domain-containing protein, partial [Firmicutes bacterium]|nr:DUF2207 domain-containing protein [Bacillota bacterium]
MSKKITLSRCCSLILLVCLLFIVPGQALARSFYFRDVTINATVTPAGDMWVEEIRTADFNGTYKGMYMWIKTQPPITITDVTVAEEGTPLTFNPGSEAAGDYFTRDEGNQYYIDWSFDATNTERSFSIRYLVNDVVQVHDDVAELNFQFIGNEWDVPTNNVAISLQLPEGANPDEIRVWGHGPLYGDVSIADDGDPFWEVNPLPANTFVEGRVTFPTSLVPQASQKTGKTALPDILAEEQAWADQANRERDEARERVKEDNRRYTEGVIPSDSPALPYIFWIVILTGIAFAYTGWSRYGKEFTPTFDGDYYRELPGDYTPAELGSLWRFGKPSAEDLTATLIDLARKGYVQIEEITVEKRGLFSREKQDYRAVRIVKDDPLLQHEQD